MADTWTADDSIRAVELLVREACHYVRASEDLRPRVLEAARLTCGEQRAQRCFRRLMILVFLCALFTISGSGRVESESSRPNAVWAAASFHELLSPTASATVRSGDGDWRLIDAFTSLRHQQAEVLHFEM